MPKIRLVICSMAILVSSTAFLLYSPHVNAFQQQKSDYAYWSEIPEVAQVIKDVQADDELETAARMLAAYFIMHRLVEANAGHIGKLPWPPRERELDKAYTTILDRIPNVVDPRRPKIQSQALRYQADRAFTRQFLERYFSQAALHDIEPIISRFEADAQHQVNWEQEHPAPAVPPSGALGVLASWSWGQRIALGVTLLLFLAVGRKKFLRSYEGEIKCVGAGTWTSGPMGSNTCHSVFEIGEHELKSVVISEYLSNYVTAGKNARLLFWLHRVVAAKIDGRTRKDSLLGFLLSVTWGLLCVAPSVILLLILPMYYGLDKAQYIAPWSDNYQSWGTVWSGLLRGHYHPIVVPISLGALWVLGINVKLLGDYIRFKMFGRAISDSTSSPAGHTA